MVSPDPLAIRSPLGENDTCNTASVEEKKDGGGREGIWEIGVNIRREKRRGKR